MAEALGKSASLHGSEHAVLVNVFETGVLITGRSGIGKSACALELIDKGHQLVADDVVEIERFDYELCGFAPPALYGLLEIRGLGICDVGQLFGSDRLLDHHRIDLCVEFCDPAPALEQPDRIGAKRLYRSLLGLDVPLVVFQVLASQNLSVLVETAVRYFNLGGSLETQLIDRHDNSLKRAATVKTKA
jgi:HPr kinase/phosphorylase